MKPLQRAIIPQSEIDGVLASTRRDWEADPAAYRARWHIPAEITLAQHLADVAALAIEGEIWMNDVYQVQVRPIEPPPGWPEMVHLSIKRRDREPIHDWRDLQWIKNELVNPESEGVELYPAESRVVDTANQYHLWVFAQPGPQWPVGYAHGVKSSTALGKSQQRPFG